MVTDLGPNEPHPAALDALAWIRQQPHLPLWLESFASTALSGNRSAEICGETLRRLLAGEPVSDRYVLGLAWTMRYSQMKPDDSLVKGGGGGRG